MAIENEYPPLLWADTPQAEIVALREQVRQAEAHNADLRADLARLRAFCTMNLQAAKARYAQTGDADWLLKRQVHEAYLALFPPGE